jgi:gas vesicle protein
MDRPILTLILGLLAGGAIGAVASYLLYQYLSKTRLQLSLIHI